MKKTTKEIDKDQFCKDLHISENSWIFPMAPGLWDRMKFWMETDEDGGNPIYCYDNGFVDRILKFKPMPQYHETWSKVEVIGAAENEPKMLWSTFAEW